MISSYPGCNSWYITEGGGNAYNATWQIHERLVHEFLNILDNKIASKQSKILHIKHISIDKSILIQHTVYIRV